MQMDLTEDKRLPNTAPLGKSILPLAAQGCYAIPLGKNTLPLAALGDAHLHSICLANRGTVR
jgi:hypothetical protein